VAGIQEGVQALRWVDGHLELIDQRILPASLQYISVNSAETTAFAITDMVVRGAPAIGVAAAFGVALEALRLQNESALRFQDGMQQAFEVLGKSRPTAVNLFWALERMRASYQSVEGGNLKEVAKYLLDQAHLIYEEDIRINQKLGAFGAALLKDGDRVMTHCNAGALATAGFGTALGVIRAAVLQGKNISVIANETRPFLQGARLTAWEMVQENIPVTLITDNMSGYMMNAGAVDAIVVGADRVSANGDVANKIGTYMIAVLASRHKIPFYVACPISTIDFSLETGRDIPIEERSADEVRGFRENHWAAEGVSIRNPSFDVTPVELVSALITEKGVVPNEVLKRGALKQFVQNESSRV
jgi:methylthioribose-1-phosphate isomerase